MLFYDISLNNQALGALLNLIGGYSMFRKDGRPTKEEAKQLNDELDLKLEQDRGIHQRFAEQLRRYEENPDLSFLRPELEDAGVLVRKQSAELHDEDGRPKAFMTFRANSPLNLVAVEEDCPRPDYDDEDDDDEFVPIPSNPVPSNSANPMESEILFEIRKNTDLLLIFSQRQREAQERLANAYQQRDYDKLDNPRIDMFTKELNDLIIPIQCLSVALGGLNINLKLVRENDIRRILIAQPDHALNDNAGTVPYLEPVDRPSVLDCKRK